MIETPLQLPAVEKTSHLLFDTDPRKLVAEIRDLPYADIPSALLIAHRRLYTFNRFAMSPAQRLELTRPFHYAFLRFVEHYRQYFEQASFAREPHPEEIDNLLAFLTELATAFKHLTNDTLARSKRPGSMGLVLYMTLNYLLHVALFSWNRGRVLKPSFWQEVHFLYFTAREMAQHQSSLQAPDDRQVMVEQIYKQIVLLGLCSPYSLAPEEHWRCYDYLSRFAGLVEISPAQEGDSAEGYTLSADCNQPALVPGTSSLPESECLLLNLAPFVDNLQRHIEAVRSGGALRNAGMDRLPRKKAHELLTRLHRQWTRNPVRSSQRQPCEETIGLVWGLETICTMLDPVLRRQATLYGNGNDQNNRAWTEAENLSHSGMRLRVTGEDDIFPEAGQVVALIRQQKDQKWLEVGIVQWCALDNADLPTLGIERLPGKASKVAILPQEDQDTERNGLLVTDRPAGGNARSWLLGPTGVIRSGVRTRVVSPHQAGELTLEASGVTHQTRQVEAFEIRALR